MFETSKKRSRRTLDCKSAARCNCIAVNRTSRANPKLFSAAVLTLATLVITGDTTNVVAFTPNSSSRASFPRGPVSSSIIDSNKNEETIALKISPLSTKRRRPRRQARQQAVGSVSSTVVDDDSTTTATFGASASSPAAPAASDHGVSIMASPMLRQEQRKRTGNLPRLLDEEYFHRNDDEKDELAVKLLFNDDIASNPLLGTTSHLGSTDNNIKRNHNSKIVRPKSRNSALRKKSRSKKSTSKRESTSLLTRDEERQITYRIRDLRRVVHIRDALIAENEQCLAFHTSYGSDNDCLPTEEDWAKACGLDVLSLRKVMSEGQDARSLLVSANAGLVKNIAKRHYYVLKQMTTAAGGVGTILTLQDMIQEGNLGLMKAAERFEPERGFRFSTYATYWIRQRILQSITDSSRVIRLPVHGKSQTAIQNIKSHLFSQ